MTGTAGSDLAELASLSQVVRDPLSKLAWARPTDRLHPGPRVEVPVVVAVLWQDHDTLRRVLEIKSDHGPSVAACPVADCGADLAPRLSPAVPAGVSLALKRLGNGRL